MSPAVELGPVAVVAAHADDEVLGCGGTLARLAASGRDVHVLLLADGESSRGDGSRTPLNPSRVALRNAAANAAAQVMGCRTVRCLGLPDNRLDSVDLLDVVQAIERFLADTRPSTVFTHHGGDVNIDHRVAHQAVLVAARPQPGHHVKQLLFFEVPSSTEWAPPGSGSPFTPTWFVDISATLDTKRRALGCYESEMRPFPHPRSIEAVEALARWRGATIGAPAAEAFVLGRCIFDGASP